MRESRFMLEQGPGQSIMATIRFVQGLLRIRNQFSNQKSKLRDQVRNHGDLKSHTQYSKMSYPSYKLLDCAGKLCLLCYVVIRWAGECDNCTHWSYRSWCKNGNNPESIKGRFYVITSLSDSWALHSILTRIGSP